MRNKIFVTITLLVALLGFYLLYPIIKEYYRRLPVVDPDQLRLIMINNITNPFKDADTVIVVGKLWAVCGNSRPEELPVIFDPQLLEEYSLKKLSERLNTPVLTNYEFSQLKSINKYPKEIVNLDSLHLVWESCYDKKVQLNILAEKLYSGKVRAYEEYEYTNQIVTVTKDYIYKDGKWILSVVNR